MLKGKSVIKPGIYVKLLLFEIYSRQAFIKNSIQDSAQEAVAGANNTKV